MLVAGWGCGCVVVAMLAAMAQCDQMLQHVAACWQLPASRCRVSVRPWWSAAAGGVWFCDAQVEAVLGLLGSLLWLDMPVPHLCVAQHGGPLASEAAPSVCLHCCLCITCICHPALHHGLPCQGLCQAKYLYQLLYVMSINLFVCGGD